MYRSLTDDAYAILDEMNRDGEIDTEELAEAEDADLEDQLLDEAAAISAYEQQLAGEAAWLNELLDEAEYESHPYPY